MSLQSHQVDCIWKESVRRVLRPGNVSQIRLMRQLEGHTGGVECVAFSPDGTLLASGSADTSVRLWRVADGEPLHTLEGHTASVLCLAFSPDGALLASGSADTTVQLWRVAPPHKHT